MSILEKLPIDIASDRTQDRPNDRVVSIDEKRLEKLIAKDPEPLAESEPEQPEEFEIVLGRTQIASVLFVATVIVVTFSAISYLAGKSISPKPVAAAAPAIAAAPAPVPAPAPVVAAKALEPSKPDAPLFADPKNGLLYIQLGAVEKGMAIVITEGLRKRSLDAFVAPGPNEHIFRVLIGPLDAAGYQKAKETIEGLGLTSFAKKTQQ